MKTERNHQSIKEILENIESLELRERRGAKFRFPVYMTEALSKTDIEALELSVRSQNCLRRAGIMTIGDLCTRIHSSAELKQLRNCGTTSVEEILDHLFVYQYNVLSPERRKDFVARVVELNLLQTKDASPEEGRRAI